MNPMKALIPLILLLLVIAASPLPAAVTQPEADQSRLPESPFQVHGFLEQFVNQRALLA